MVRRCVVPSCTSTDQTAMSHRFPRNHLHCKTWQKRLSLNSYQINDLLEKYVVCAHHFRITDYRHKESKHLNTTAIPTLEIVPENEKNVGIRAVALKESKAILANVKLSSRTEKNSINQRSDPVEKMKIFSNCFTLSRSSLVTPINSYMHHSACNSMEENYLDDDLLHEQKEPKDVSYTKNLLNSETTTEYWERETVEDDTSLSSVKNNNNSNLETDIHLNEDLRQYIELIETEETDEEGLAQSDEEGQVPLCEDGIVSEWKEYRSLSKKDLVDQLITSKKRIKELEMKLVNIEKVHTDLIQNVNNFNKVLIS